MTRLGSRASRMTLSSHKSATDELQQCGQYGYQVYQPRKARLAQALAQRR